MSGEHLALTIEIDREDDGRWIAEIPQIPGVLAYGMTEDAARSAAVALAFRVLADRVESGEVAPGRVSAVSFAAA